MAASSSSSSRIDRSRAASREVGRLQGNRVEDYRALKRLVPSFSVGPESAINNNSIDDQRPRERVRERERIRGEYGRKGASKKQLN